MDTSPGENMFPLHGECPFSYTVIRQKNNIVALSANSAFSCSSEIEII